MVRLGRQCYAIDVSRAATALAAEIDPVAERQPRIQQVKTKFLRLRQLATLGHRIDGWRVCSVGAWDREKVFFVVMVSKDGELWLYIAKYKRVNVASIGPEAAICGHLGTSE